MRTRFLKKSLVPAVRLFCSAFVLFLMAFATPTELSASYLPDENFEPVWNGDGEEPAEGPDWNDDDGDSVPNWLEQCYGTDMWTADTDWDGLSDWDEIFSTGTDPTLWDTDGNGFSDADDLNQPPDVGDMPGGEPTQDDVDGDGLPDLWELAYGLLSYDPFDALLDPDGDGLSNLEEYLYGTDPYSWDHASTVRNSASGNGESGGPDSGSDEDQDGDGLPDAWELANGLDPTDPGDIADDPDGDFILNIEEYQHGTDPQLANDFWLVMGYSIDPGTLTRHDDGTERDADWDGDGVTNLEEIGDGTEPRINLSPNSDHVNDPDEVEGNEDTSEEAGQIQKLQIQNSDIVGYVGDSFTGQVAVSGGVPDYTFGSGGGTSGLSISGEGIISGTFNSEGTFTLVIQVSDSSDPQQTKSKIVSVLVTQRPEPDPDPDPEQETEVQSGSWVENSKEFECPHDLVDGKKPYVKLSWQEFRVYRPAPNAEKYDITKFRGLIWVLRHKELPSSVFQGGVGSIWLGSHTVSDQNLHGGKPSFINSAILRDDTEWGWGNNGVPDIKFIAWKTPELGSNLQLVGSYAEGDSVGMNYYENVFTTNGELEQWKIEFTAPKSGPPPTTP